VRWGKYENFSEEEFKCQCGCGAVDMDEDFIYKLQAIRTLLDAPITITSGYRCEDHDWSLGGAGNHTTGRAVDVRVGLENVHALIKWGIQHMTGIGIKMHGPIPSRFVHLDNLTGDMRPRIWSYK